MLETLTGEWHQVPAVGTQGGFVYFDNYTIRDDVLLTMTTSERTSNPRDTSGVKNKEGIESDAIPIQEPGLIVQNCIIF